MNAGTKVRNFLPYYLYVLVRLPWLVLIAPLSFHGRQLMRMAAVRMGFKLRSVGVLEESEYPIASVAATDLAGLQLGTTLYDPNGHDGSVTTYEMLVLNKLVERQNPRLIIEFGTWVGRTAINFAANAPEARIVTIDFTLQPRVFDRTSFAERIQCVTGDSTLFDTALYRGKADFIFVDGGHDAPVATSDSLKAIEMVAPTGVVVWHDFRDFKGVQEAIRVAVRQQGADNFRFIRDTSMVIYQPRGFATDSTSAANRSPIVAMS